ncbi:MAG: hypothetical protein CM1200mP30_05240 [Pseudomonadota bacterium]|nr:MAG: hypothetical protein CM1200mP30_05240 [Pseudomonadota bacterium]
MPGRSGTSGKYTSSGSNKGNGSGGCNAQGDEQTSADAVAKKTGIKNLNSAVIPEEKSKIIKTISKKDVV